VSRGRYAPKRWAAERAKLDALVGADCISLDCGTTPASAVVLGRQGICGSATRALPSCRGRDCRDLSRGEN
jgi:hypothetical protein